MGRQLCSAVGYLHRKGWLHLDLKPDNLIADGRPSSSTSASPSAGGQVAPGTGTRRWMAPEQVRGGRVTTATDVWGSAPCCARSGWTARSPRTPRGATVQDVIRWLDGLGPRPAYSRQAA